MHHDKYLINLNELHNNINIYLDLKYLLIFIIYILILIYCNIY